MATTTKTSRYMAVKAPVITLHHHKSVSRGLLVRDAERTSFMDIWLHVGAHRTGTTGLQTLLGRNHAALTRGGVVYLGPQRTRTGFFAGLIKNPDTLCQSDEALGRRSCGRIAMELQRFGHEGAQSIVLSEENMLGTMAENLASTCLYGQASARLARFAPAFIGHPPRVCVAVRSYEMAWASQLAFRIAAGAAAPTAREIDALAHQTRGWQDVICDIKAALPEADVLVWAFEDWAARPGALAEAILRQPLGLPCQRTSEMSNASEGAQRLSDRLCARGDEAGAAHVASHNQRGRYMPFSIEQQSRMQQKYCDDLAWLSAGADGVATYLDPIEGTFGGHDMTEGSLHERQKASVADPR